MGQATSDRARGRWRDILPQLGIDPRFLNGRHQACPACRGGKDRARFDDRDGDGTYICSQCGAGNGFTLLMKVHGWDFATAAKRVDEIIGDAKPIVVPKRASRPPDVRELRRMWGSSRAVEHDDPVSKYLVARLCDVVMPSVLRYVPKMRYQADVVTFHPGMLALMHDADGKPLTLHRTYLTEDGRKADVEAPRRLMPGKIKPGGAVRLSMPEDVLGIAEGIETALSASLIHGIPCWAALNAGMLREWMPPSGLRRIVVFGDNDENFTGQAAAYVLANRLVREKATAIIEVEIPRLIGHDWNDTLRETACYSN